MMQKSALDQPFACGDTVPPNPQPRLLEPFLCFQRRSPGDLVLRASGVTSPEPATWHKILGSAQRRRSGAVLQHGSLLLARSDYAPELQGVDELAGTNFAHWDPSLVLASDWGAKLASVLDLDLAPAMTSKQILAPAALALAREKFHEPSWIDCR